MMGKEEQKQSAGARLLEWVKLIWRKVPGPDAAGETSETQPEGKKGPT